MADTVPYKAQAYLVTATLPLAQDDLPGKRYQLTSISLCGLLEQENILLSDQRYVRRDAGEI